MFSLHYQFFPFNVCTQAKERKTKENKQNLTVRLMFKMYHTFARCAVTILVLSRRVGMN